MLNTYDAGREHERLYGKDNEVQAKLSVGSGFKFGFGFGAGVFIWGLLLTLIMLAIFGAIGASVPRM